jgi:two-component system sensor histidine kinase KdpD
VHGPDHAVSVLVLVLVALVTSRLATRLRAREEEALARASASEELAQISALLAKGTPAQAFERARDFVAAHYGPLRLGGEEDGFSSLDQAAAAWATHNGDATGHGTGVMAAAEWSFLPLARKGRGNHALMALARPDDGATRPLGEIEHLQQVALLLGQGWDRIALEDERRARETLAEGDRLRRTFLASLAHDFRTPLTVMTGQLEVLAARSDEAREALSAARRLERTMSDLIAAARIEEGSLRPHCESLDLVDAADAACAAAGRGDVMLSHAIPADLPFVRADAVLLHHVLINLIDNALGHARSRVMLGAQADGAQVTLWVEDDGPGVPPAERARIFERFARIEGGDRAQGSGLGLAIVRGFAEAMGMHVSIEDSPLGGARFILRMAA